MVEGRPSLGAWRFGKRPVLEHRTSGLLWDQKAMTEYDSAVLERAVTDEGSDFEPRDFRALTEYLTVLPEVPDLYEVVSQSGNSYTVDTREGACTCPDAEYNLGPDEECKHVRRARYATGERPIPAWVNPRAVDEHLGTHIDGTPRVAATDGGTEIIEAGDDGEILSEDAADRPDDCGCWDADQGLPCWPCWRNGHETPNPECDR